jgi:hypothetical protein
MENLPTKIRRNKNLPAETSTGGGLALINEVAEKFLPALQVSESYGAEWKRSIGAIGTVLDGRAFPVAKILNGFLGKFSEIKAAHMALLDVFIMGRSIDKATALRMINVLFAALGKHKSDDETATLLEATADMFNPVNDALGSVTDVPPLNRHLLIVGLAIKKLIATAKFTSAAELREAMMDVQQRLDLQRWKLEYMADNIMQADEIMFETDRAAWEAAYARVGSDVPLAMQNWSCIGEAPERDDVPGSPRWQALDAILKAKLALPAPELEATPMREAACKTTPAKRTRKPKRTADA